MTEEVSEEEEGDQTSCKDDIPDTLQFQIRSDPSTMTQPSSPKARDRLKIPTRLKSKEMVLSDKAWDKLKIRILKLAKKAKSPRILVTIRGTKIAMLVDEGAELNCIDADFANRYNIKIIPSSQSATAAGNKDLTILSETEHDLVVDTLFQSTHVPINLGKVTVISNLGADLILGEPGKAANFHKS